ncbi:putative metal-dependent hydrolase [Magnetospirillum sp. XM-1]|uniref:M48 family metallopeptidase n=1 Tax=Magnetospirillum sp. XM-1 TaxID=1663591 RepID=UPI00073DBFF2|nr:M48 family metallopeptidase [Magnetospirillum sp. XM-1]CUW38289.1 putative metal-dependent hydrolase [Magnetospirillum sp. XM-1]
MVSSFLLHLDGRSLPVTVKRSGRARNMSLRLDASGGSLVVVLPDGVPEREAERFARRQGAWIESRLAVMPGAIAFVHGAEVPLLGLAHSIRHEPEARRGVWAEEGVIHVSGRAEHLPRRVGEFLRDEARVVMAHHCRELAARLGRKLGRVAVRDTTSRWGSCTARGDLSFSWRLVMAPDFVGRYVAAHEVAHLAEMNHGPDFWALVEGLVGDIETPRAWLKRHGPQLHRYGGKV